MILTSVFFKYYIKHISKFFELKKIVFFFKSTPSVYSSIDFNTGTSFLL